MHACIPARRRGRLVEPPRLRPKLRCLPWKTTKALELNTCRESCLSNFFNTMLSQVLTLSDGTLSGLGKNHKSALNMRCHQRHFPKSAVMMARVAWVRVDPALPMALL